MALVTGPLLSLTASGSFARILNASSLRGQHVMRKHPVARQAWTGEQRSHYARLSWLQTMWNRLPLFTPAGLKQTWQTIADELELPLYQAFVKHNYGRWTPTACPIISPAGGGNFPATPAFSLFKTGKGFISFTLTSGGQNDLWGTLVGLRLNANVTFAMNEIAYVIPIDPPAPNSGRTMITHLPPGNYRIRGKGMHTDGSYAAQGAQTPNLIVT